MVVPWPPTALKELQIHITDWWMHVNMEYSFNWLTPRMDRVRRRSLAVVQVNSLEELQNAEPLKELISKCYAGEVTPLHRPCRSSIAPWLQTQPLMTYCWERKKNIALPIMAVCTCSGITGTRGLLWSFCNASGGNLEQRLYISSSTRACELIIQTSTWHTNLSRSSNKSQIHNSVTDNNEQLTDPRPNLHEARPAL